MFKKLILVSFTTILILLTTFPAVAQNGAVVTKGGYPPGWGLAFNPDEGLSYFYSNFSDVCGYFSGGDLGTVLETPWMVVQRPTDEEGEGKFHIIRFFFFRALMVTPEEFFNDPCGAWSNPDLIFADGMIRSTFNDNDQVPLNTNRANVWGFSAAGALEDVADHCSGEMIGFKWSWMGQFKDDTFVLRKQVGPELRCN